MDEEIIIKYAMPILAYRIVWGLLLSFHSLCIIKSCLKLRAVMSEQKHSAQPLKQLFWQLVVGTTIFLFLSRIHGWSEDELVQQKSRCVTECFLFMSNQLFTLVLFTTFSVIEIVVRMASGNSKAIMDWNKFYKSFIILCLLMSFGTLWTIFNVVRFFMRCPFLNDPNNMENAETFKGYIIDNVWFILFSDMYTVFNILELFVWIWLIKMLGVELYKVGKLMEMTKALRTAKKYKLREWVIFISLCMAVVLCNSVISLSSLKDSTHFSKSVLDYFVPTMLEQETPELAKTSSDYISVGRSDIVVAAMNVIIGGSITFAAPCRKVR